MGGNFLSHVYEYWKTDASYGEEDSNYEDEDVPTTSETSESGLGDYDSDEEKSEEFDNCDGTLLNFPESDRNRFYLVHPFAALQTVGLFRLEVSVKAREESGADETLTIAKICRSSRKGHAEEQFIFEAKKQIQSRLGQNAAIGYDRGSHIITRLSLQINMIHTPCGSEGKNCQQQLVNLLTETFKPRPEFIELRLSFANVHFAGRTHDIEFQIKRLAGWLIKLESKGIKAVLAPLCVTKQIVRPNRLTTEALRKRREKDRAVAENVRRIYIQKELIERTKDDEDEEFSMAFERLTI